VFNDASQYGDVWGSERTDPPILNLGTGRRWAVSPLLFLEERLRYEAGWTPEPAWTQ
jgi:hypothetical protein